jgi:hypothetical protein
MTMISQLSSDFAGSCSPETLIAYLEGFASGVVFVSCAFVVRGMRRW